MKSIYRAGRVILALSVVSYAPGTSSAAVGPTARPAPVKVMAPQLPLYFEANHGQAGTSVKFLSRGPGFNLYLTGSEAVLVLKQGLVKLHLKGSHPPADVEGRGLLPGQSNYFIGPDSKKWITGAAHYAQVAYRQVYPGIDLLYESEGPQLEYSFVVAPHANPGRIRMDFQGAERLRLDREGNLLLTVKAGAELAFKAPVLYQQIAGERVAVAGRFVLLGETLVRFEIGDYLRTHELIIDPVLQYSTYLGGTVADRAFAIDVDASGAAYVAGATASNLFPGAAGQFQPANGGGTSDVFVTKINPAGTAVVWSTYLGGGGNDQANGIAVDGLGIVHITGSTSGSFPVANAFQAASGGGTDAFVAAINAAGTALIYSTYLGHAGLDSGSGIAVSAAGIAYVTGQTTSASFPVSVGVFQGTIGGAADAFVASFDAAGGRRYASFLGGTGADHGNAIAVDGLGNAYVTGICADNFPVFPTAPPAAEAFKLTITGSDDAFISKVDPTGAALLYSTYVGGSGIEEGTAIALDGANNAYITGYTFSANFPKAGYAGIGQTAIGTAPDAFVFKLQIGNGGGSLDGAYSTYLGASTDDRGMSIAVDPAGDAYVSGHTTSGDFPTVNPLPGETVLGATGKAFVTELGPTGGIKEFSTYLGGTTDQAGQGIALDSQNNIYVAGWTNSTDFDTALPIQAANAGTFDVFLSKISAPTPAVSSGPGGGSSVTPGFSINPVRGTDAGGTQVIITGTGLLGTTSISFAGVSAASFTIDSDTQVTAISPAHAAEETIDVVVTRTSGNAVAGTYSYTTLLPSASGPASYIFPSPANGPTASVVYTMAEAGTAQIRVYNEVGDLVTKLEDHKPGGVQTSTFNTARLAPGVYFYILNLNYNSGKSDERKLKKFVVKH